MSMVFTDFFRRIDACASPSLVFLHLKNKKYTGRIDVDENVLTYYALRPLLRFCLKGTLIFEYSARFTLRCREETYIFRHAIDDAMLVLLRRNFEIDASAISLSTDG